MRRRVTPETPEKDWAQAFLAELAETANVRRSCKVACVSRATAYRRRNEDPDFAAAWAGAMEDACDLLEEEARKRATKRQRPSDLLLIFLLKAHRPEKYRDNVRHEHAGSIVVSEELVDGSSPASADAPDKGPTGLPPQ